VRYRPVGRPGHGNSIAARRPAYANGMGL